MRFTLPDTEEVLLLTPRWGGDGSFPVWGAVLGGAVFVGLLLWLFRWEAKLIRRSAAVLLFTLRLVVIALVGFIACFEPRLVHEYTESAPGRVLVALDVSGSMSLADERTPLEQLRLARTTGILRDRTDLPRTLTDAWERHLERGASPNDLPWLTDEERNLGADEQAKQMLDRQRVFASLQKKAAALSRLEVGRRILGDDGWGLLQKLKAEHGVETLFFAESASSVDNKSRQADSIARGSDLRLPLERALVEKGKSETPLLGVVLLSDGRHNIGEGPLPLASRLGRLGVPVYPVALGGEAQPDLAVLSAKAPATALRGMEFSVQVQVQASRLAAQDILVEVFRKGEKKPLVEAKRIAHKGERKGNRDAVYSLSIPLKIEEAGTHGLEVKARLSDKAVKEGTLENNHHAAVVRIVQEKPRVLLVDGDARWEYHYLSTFVTRAPNLEVERVLFQQPRLGLQSEEKLEKIGFARRKLPAPKDGATSDDPLFGFDCIVLGDVSPEDLPTSDRERLRRYVAERGGTLVLVSGKRHLPLAYAGKTDPLEPLLPVTDIKVEAPKDQGFAIALSELGKATPWLALADNPAQSVKTWAELPKHFWGLTGKAKPGATVLATTAWEEKKEKSSSARGVIVQQNFGLGRVLWLGVESTWRFRRWAGDTHHHRFWGQLILWAGTKDLLPAGNQHVRFGSRQPVYSPDQDADLAVRLGTKIALAGIKGKVGMKLVRILPDGKEEVLRNVPLEPNESQPRLFEHKVKGLEPGRYRVEPVLASLEKEVKEALAEKGGDGTFRVLPTLSKEMLDPAPDPDLLYAIARESGGKAHTPSTLDELVRGLERRIERKEYRHEKRLWRDEPFVWWIFALVSGFLTLEWLGRKWAGLP